MAIGINLRKGEKVNELKEMNILIKPASSACNMQCKYCFYKDEAQKRNVNCYGMMQEEVMEHLIKKALDYAQERCVFGFQGGEPTLIGLEFFENFTEMVEKYNKKKISIEYCLQTNGMLIDDDWIQFLADKKFLVGVSLDGPKEIHDQNRLDSKKKSTFIRVTRTIEKMLKSNIKVNVLTVLTKQSAHHVEQIYRFLKKIGVRYQQYIPCLDPLGKERGEEYYSLTPKRFAEAQKRLFDLWFADLIVNDYVYIRQFENWVGVLKGYTPEACTMYGKCTMQNVVEANGDVFPCDFYALDEYKIGNITREGFEQIYEKSLTHPFFEDALKRDERCLNCHWYPICRGGCRRDCSIDESGVAYNYYCEAYQEIFAYIIERLEYLVAR